MLEQTFFCSFLPKQRKAYINKVFDLLKPGGKLVGVLFKHPLDEHGERPFGGDEPMYRSLFGRRFEIEKMELCHNSIPQRQGNEFFIILKRTQ